MLELLTGTNIYESTVGEVPRATGPFPHWHNLGGYLFLVLLLGFSLVLERERQIISRRMLVLTLAPALAALIQTASFAPLFGTIAGALLIGVSMGQGRRVLAWLGVAAVVGGMLFGPLLEERVVQQYRETTITQDQSLVPQTIEFRYRVWTTQFVPVIRENVIWGYGPTLPPRLFFGYAESLYVTLLLRGGVLLLLSYFAVMVALAMRARGAVRSEGLERRVVGRVVLAAVPLLMLIDVIATYFLDSGPAPLLWVLAGLMATEPKTRLARSPVADGSERPRPALAGV
jgi:O-antigen ligase